MFMCASRDKVNTNENEHKNWRQNNIQQPDVTIQILIYIMFNVQCSVFSIVLLLTGFVAYILFVEMKTFSFSHFPCPYFTQIQQHNIILFIWLWSKNHKSWINLATPEIWSKLFQYQIFVKPHSSSLITHHNHIINSWII